MSFVGIFGHVNIDHIVNLNKLPKPGTSQEVTSREQRLGGTAANIAIYCASLGTPTALASFVGPDLPEEYRERLESTGMDLTDLVTVPDHLTPRCWVLSDPDQKQMYFIDQGVFTVLPDMPVLENTVKNSEWVHISTGKPEYYITVAKLAKKEGKKVCLDPGQEIHFLYNSENIKQIIGYCDLFFGNTLEAEVAEKLLGGKLTEFVETAIVTDGKEGSTIFTGQEIISVPVTDIQTTKDATGAGDAYRAGFYTGLFKGYDLDLCGLIGSATASLVVGRKDPLDNPPTWDEVAELAGI